MILLLLSYNSEFHARQSSGSYRMACQHKHMYSQRGNGGWRLALRGGAKNKSRETKKRGQRELQLAGSAKHKAGEQMCVGTKITVKGNYTEGKRSQESLQSCQQSLLDGIQ